MNLFEVPVYVKKIKLDNKSILQYCKKLKKEDLYIKDGDYSIYINNKPNE